MEENVFHGEAKVLQKTEDYVDKITVFTSICPALIRHCYVLVNVILSFYSTWTLAQSCFVVCKVIFNMWDAVLSFFPSFFVTLKSLVTCLHNHVYNSFILGDVLCYCAWSGSLYALLVCSVFFHSAVLSVSLTAHEYLEFILKHLQNNTQLTVKPPNS